MTSGQKSSVLLSSRGLEAGVDARLVREKEAWEHDPAFRSHGHTLRRLFSDLKVDAVLCLDNRPSVCVKDARTLSQSQIEDLRRKLWNLGTTTLLVLETERDVQVFSTIAKPVHGDETGVAARLPNETIEDLEDVILALSLQRLIRRIETGAIYREHKSLFDSQASVNRRLLDNLKTLRNLISPQKTKISYQRAHALIGRFLFSCYLLDRGIIGPRYLTKANLPEATDMQNLLDQSAKGSRTLQILFNALQRDFNGSLYGEGISEYKITDAEVNFLRRFLAGENLRTGQLSLYKLYDFAFIPVELISSIYEEFLGAESDAEQLTRQEHPRRHHRRTQGAYYTPPRLAELVVDIATEDWRTLLDKRCLDPACGSGVFLVILFIRMAEEWRQRNPGASTRSRYDALLKLLSENLCGIDIQLTACLVTCFSLYLAFLDQMEPKEIVELQEVLKHDVQQKLLPRILWEKNKVRPKPPHFASILETDFFAFSSQREFHLVIGNPPWVSRRVTPSVEDWLFSYKENPYLSEIPKSKQKQTLFPAREVACGFMWKVGLHLLPGGRVCQLLPTRVFLSNNTNHFQAAWLGKHRLETIWLLADWSFILFRSADCPCFIARYHVRTDREDVGEFEYITPKVELLDPREALIPILPEDQKTLLQGHIVTASGQEQAATAWKELLWGTPRDVRLIDRLMTLPRLSSLATRPPRMDRNSSGKRNSEKRKRWWSGQGFQPLTSSDVTDSENQQEPWRKWWSMDHPFLSATTTIGSYIIDRPKRYGTRGEFLRRSIAPELTRPPLVVVNKALTKAFFSDYRIVFQDDFQAFAGPKSDEDLLLFLTAYLNTDLVQYLIFHTSANIGLERDIVRLEEILSLPFPLPEHTRNPKANKEIITRCASILRNQYKLAEDNILHSENSQLDAKREFTGLVYAYFEICEWERILIEDTVNVFRPSSTPGSLDSDKLITVKPSNSSHRKAYAETLLSTFRGWTRTPKQIWARGIVAEGLRLAFITVGVGDVASGYSETQAEPRVTELLSNLKESSKQNGHSTHNRLRGFVYYEPNRVHVLKPLNLRYWTRTAALNDADEILTKMMDEGGWRG